MTVRSEFCCPSCGWPMGSDWCRKTHEMEQRQFQYEVADLATGSRTKRPPRKKSKET
jgi:hypothetical protein